MNVKEAQEEELQVLRSIYEGDELFKEINPTTFQYKFGEDGNHKSFLLEISWPEEYPESPAIINLNAFYNKHLNCTIKREISTQLQSLAETCVGEAMTYTLIDHVNENFDELMANQTLETSNSDELKTTEELGEVIQQKKEKKEILTKSQKRRLADRTNFKGEHERGWNWVDLVKHLSKTGGTTDKT